MMKKYLLKNLLELLLRRVYCLAVISSFTLSVGLARI